jgi:hypothetical protein
MRRWAADIEVEAIIITDEKSEYIEREHQVSRSDVWSVFGLAPHYLADELGRYSMIGPSPEGRHLMVGLMPTDENATWRLVTAHWLRPGRARRLYGESA